MSITDQAMKQVVESFFEAWEGGDFGAIRTAYDEYLSDHCIHENSGLAPMHGKQAILDFIEIGASSVGVATMTVEARAWGFGPNTIFSERIDYHRDADGKLTLAPRICGVMVFNDEGKITRWSDYYDPAHMLAYLNGKVALAPEPA